MVGRVRGSNHHTTTSRHVCACRRLATTSMYLQLFALLSVLLALSMAPNAEARLVGGGGRRLTQEMQHGFSPIMATKHEANKREEVSAEFAIKYPLMAAEIRRRRQQKQQRQRQQQQQQQEGTQDGENDASSRNQFQDIIAVVDTAKSRGLQSTTQQLTVTPTNDRTKPLVTLTLRKQTSSSLPSSPVDTMLQNEVSNVKAIKGLNHRGAQTLEVEFLLDRPERQTRTKFHVQMNLVALAMGRTDGLSITAEEAGRTVNGSVTDSRDKLLIISENPDHGIDGDSDGHPKQNGLHLMAVAPQSKPPASLDPPLIDETLLPP